MAESAHPAKRVLLGMLTPSSNTVLEPVTAAMLGGLPEVSAHFGRLRVTEISLSNTALSQFDNEPLIKAANLLSDARVDVIAWNGTSAGWRGFDADEELCKLISQKTGIRATSSVLALNEIFDATGVTRFGLVTPYLADVQEKIIANYASAGFTCAAEQHLNDRGNFSFSEVTEQQIVEMVRAVAAAEPQAITTFCTNLFGAPIVDALESELGIPIYDSVAVTVWKSLTLAGVDPRRIQGWGRLFRESPEL